MSSVPQVQVPERLLAEGVSIIGIGLMGAAYTARLSALGVPVTIFNRTASKAAAVAKAHRNVTVAPSIEACARASNTVLVACSPTMEAVSSICNQLVAGDLARGRDVIFIVDCGRPPARIMDEVLFEKGGAASVTNVGLWGASFQVIEGQGIMNASGRSRTETSVPDVVLPLLGLFATVTYHPGGPEVAALFAMGAHLACFPLFYGFMHYAAVMKKGGIDSTVALRFFQTLNQGMLDMAVPFVQAAIDQDDFSFVMGSHQLVRDIIDAGAETCRELGVDPKLSELMSDYHQRALRDPELAAKSYHSAYRVIDPPAPRGTR